jgi:hypothetical protein
VLHGVDVSSHQGTDWKPSPDDVFVGIKASEGHTYVSPTLGAQVATARAAGLVVLLYHFLWPGDPQVQAQWFERTVRPYAVLADLLVCDWEATKGGTATEADKDAFIAEVRRLLPGYKVGVYVNRSQWNASAKRAGDFLWLAAYTADPGVTGWTFWQYADHGPNGEPLDQNYANFATVTELRDWINPPEVDMSYFNEKVQWDGPYVGKPRYVDRRTLDQLHEVEHIVGHRIVMYQGSWSDGDLSADTHAGAGAADIGPTGGDGWRELETAARQVGMAAFLRPWTQNYHVHALSIGNPYLAPWAKVQVQAYFAGYDGLGPNARSGRDTGNRSYVDITWEEYMPTAEDIAKATVAEQIRRGTELGKAIAKGFLTADDIITAGRNEPSDTNTHWAPKTFVTNDFNAALDLREDLQAIRTLLERLAIKPTP